MRKLTLRELRTLARTWPLWLLLPLVAYLAYRMAPLNAEFYTKFRDFDPQSVEDMLAAYATDVRAVHTTGFGWAQLLALAVGAFTVLRDPRLTGRRPLPPGVVDPGPLLLAKAVAAASGALLLAAADLAVALPIAHRYVAEHWTFGTFTAEGVTGYRLALADRTVWTAVAAGAVCFPLYAVAGVGIGAMIGSWRRLGIGLFWYLVIGGTLSVAVGGLAFGLSNGANFMVVPIVALAIPAAAWCLYWLAAVSGWSLLTVPFVALAAVMALLLGYRSNARRLARTATATAQVE